MGKGTMTNRTHLVLIPGFGGFDALGRLRYYEGVVPRFEALVKQGAQGFDRLRLHFFDNLPTAAVETRALLLWEFLAKRVERREIVEHDSLVLLGHSTGALDLRQLVEFLQPAGRARLREEFPSREPDEIDAVCERLGKSLVRAVFLSAPHRGAGCATTLANEAPFAMPLAARAVHCAVRALRAAPADALSRLVLFAGAGIAGSDALTAAREAVAEARPRRGQSPLDRAHAREAYSDLYLWSRNFAEDSAALDDLRGDRAPKIPVPTAADEDSVWARVEVLSILSRAHPAGAQRDAVYRLLYELTSRGEVGDPGRFTVRRLGRPDEEVAIDDGAQNDGIVNTRSMHWPLAACQRLVEADHADVIGHYARARFRAKRAGRTHRAFDLLGSQTPFGRAEFDALWDGVLRFCASGTTYGL